MAKPLSGIHIAVYRSLDAGQLQCGFVQDGISSLLTPHSFLLTKGGLYDTAAQADVIVIEYRVLTGRDGALR